MGSLGGVILFSIALIAVVIVIAKKNADRLMAEGKIVQREEKFYEAEHIFTLVNGDYKTVEQALKNLDLREMKIKESYYENGGKPEILYKSTHGWNADIRLVDSSGGKYIWNFSIPVYSTHNGIPQGILKMNMMLTAVEKIFLQIDPNTIVESKKVDYKYQKD